MPAVRKDAAGVKHYRSGKVTRSHYLHRPHTPPGLCPDTAGGFDGPKSSLGISWWLYYDPQLKDFYESTAWTLEEQPDGGVLLTDGEGNQVLYVAKGELNPEVTGACGQYDDVPGYNVELSYSGGRYTVAQKSGNSIEFGAHGGKHKPDVVRDTNNTTLTYAYDAAGRAATIPVPTAPMNTWATIKRGRAPRPPTAVRRAGRNRGLDVRGWAYLKILDSRQRRAYA